MEGLSESELPDPIRAFTPKMEIGEELEVLRTAKKSLGGEALRPIEIDMDILVDAYPREGIFLSSSMENSLQPINLGSPRTPAGSKRHDGSPTHTTSKKTPNRRFFKSEHEREYARNLMKELVQIYILQGVHGKDAFRQALNETRRRIHVRRGECAPSPPAILSPVHESPYPKLSPPRESHTPYSEHKATRTASELQPEVQSGFEPRDVGKSTTGDSSSPSKKIRNETRLGTPRTPSRVQSMVAAIQASPIKHLQVENVVRRTPMSSRVKVVADSMENKPISPMKPAEVSDKDNVVSPPSTDQVASSATSPPKQVFEASNKRIPRESARHDESVPARTSPRIRKVDVNEPKMTKSKRAAASSDERGTKGGLSSPSKIKKHDEPQQTVGKLLIKKPEAVSQLDDAPTSPTSSEVVKRPKKAGGTPLTETSSHVNTRRRKASEALQDPPKSKQPAKGVKTPARKRKEADLETIPEDEPVVVPIRPSRRAKTAANEALIK